jgi:hypothetical protein
MTWRFAYCGKVSRSSGSRGIAIHAIHRLDRRPLADLIEERAQVAHLDRRPNGDDVGDSRGGLLAAAALLRYLSTKLHAMIPARGTPTASASNASFMAIERRGRITPGAMSRR